MVVPINSTSSALVVPWLSVLGSGSMARDTWLYIYLALAPWLLVHGSCMVLGPMGLVALGL